MSYSLCIVDDDDDDNDDVDDDNDNTDIITSWLADIGQEGGRRLF